jgi:hypothetical protein
MRSEGSSNLIVQHSETRDKECDNRATLLAEYHTAIVGSSVASNAFSQVAHHGALADYHMLLRLQEEAEVRIVKTRSAYEQHVAKHGCTGHV